MVENHQNLKILLIDDNKNITNMLTKFFELKGHACTTSNDGRNGLTLIEERKFDVVLLDISMPEFTGYDVIDYLAKKNLLKKQKIVVLTATAITDEQINSLRKKGISSCLKKPIGLDALIDAIMN